MQESEVRQYELKSKKLVFKESYGGKEENYVKMKEIGQNEAGDQFVCPYFDDGKFKLRLFGE
jgi:hypothetical protein